MFFVDDVPELKQKRYSINYLKGFFQVSLTISRTEQILQEKADDAFCKKYKCEKYLFFRNDTEGILIFKRKKTAQNFLNKVLLDRMIKDCANKEGKLQ